jgi:protein disulfide-isomerase A6
MARVSFALVSLLALLTGMVQAGSAVIDLIPDNFDKVVLNSGKPSLVEFFAPWCGHCKNLAPVYEELAQAFSFASDKLNIAKLDADEHKPLSKKYGVGGFPTLKFFDGKSSDPIDYDGGRDLESLTSFLTEKTGIKPRAPKKLPSNVQLLTDTTFAQEIGGDKNVLVAFTAPWCGRKFHACGCWNLTPLHYSVL